MLDGGYRFGPPARLPRVVTFWTEEELRRFERQEPTDGWWCARAPGDVANGDCAAVCVAGTAGAWLVGVFDYGTSCIRDLDVERVAWGRMRFFDAPVSAQELFADGFLDVYWEHPGTLWGLPTEAERRLQESIPALPKPSEPEAAPPGSAASRWTSVPTRRYWESKLELKRAIASSTPILRALGLLAGDEDKETWAWAFSDFGSACTTLERDDSALVALHLDAGLLALEELYAHAAMGCRTSPDAELAYERAVSLGLDPSRGMDLHLVVARSYSSWLADVVARTPNVRLWMCLRDPDDSPQLIEILSVCPDPDLPPAGPAVRPHALGPLTSRPWRRPAESLACAAGLPRGVVDGIVDGGELGIPPTWCPETYVGEGREEFRRAIVNTIQHTIRTNYGEFDKEDAPVLAVQRRNLPTPAAEDLIELLDVMKRPREIAPALRARLLRKA